MRGSTFEAGRRLVGQRRTGNQRVQPVQEPEVAGAIELGDQLVVLGPVAGPELGVHAATDRSE